MVPFSILYYFVTKELAASLAVEGKARGVDVHAVHPSPAACSAMSASCVPLTCHGPACLAKAWWARANFWTWFKVVRCTLIRNA